MVSLLPRSVEDEHAAAHRVGLDVLVGTVDVGQRIPPLNEPLHVDQATADPVRDARHVLARVGRAVVAAPDGLLHPRDTYGLERRGITDGRDTYDDGGAALAQHVDGHPGGGAAAVGLEGE